jgi:hypothetical protein
VQGKTKFQKSMYFLGLLTGCLSDLGYHAHYYGPYSEEIAEAMDWLRIIGAVDYSSSGGGTADSAGFEIRRYDYRLNDEGRAFAQNAVLLHPEVWQKLQSPDARLQLVGKQGYLSLSIAAKSYRPIFEQCYHLRVDRSQDDQPTSHLISHGRQSIHAGLQI